MKANYNLDEELRELQHHTLGVEPNLDVTEVPTERFPVPEFARRACDTLPEITAISTPAPPIKKARVAYVPAIFASLCVLLALCWRIPVANTVLVFLGYLATVYLTLKALKEAE